MVFSLGIWILFVNAMHLIQQDQDSLELQFWYLTCRIPTINVTLPCRKCPLTKVPKEKQQPKWPSMISPQNHGPERNKGQKRRSDNYHSTSIGGVFTKNRKVGMWQGIRCTWEACIRTEICGFEFWLYF